MQRGLIYHISPYLFHRECILHRGIIYNVYLAARLHFRGVPLWRECSGGFLASARSFIEREVAPVSLTHCPHCPHCTHYTLPTVPTVHTGWGGPCVTSTNLCAMQRNTVQSYPLTIAQQSVSQQPSCNAVQFFLICVLRSAATMHLITQHYTEQIKTWEAHRLINLKRRCCWTAIGGEGEDKEFRSSADFLEKIARKTNMTLQWSTDKYKNLRNNNWAQVDL